MSGLYNNALIGASGSQGGGGAGYQIERSVRLRSSASAYLERTLGAGNQKTWTWSGWVKRGELSTAALNGKLFIASAASDANFMFVDINSSQIRFFSAAASVFDLRITTVALYRDPSAWYHFVVALDAVNSTAKIYANGIEQTVTVATAVTNKNYSINSAIRHRIARDSRATDTTDYFDGYLAEINFIDGQALTPSSFGETNATTGVWGPKQYTGTYGTNGFYLNFVDNSAATATTIGKDNSGNGNNWTPNNISVTAGVTYDSMLDVPTPYDDGGNGRGNYCVLSPLDVYGGACTLTEGNLTGALSAVNGCRRATTSVSSGKWYWEVTIADAINYHVVGVSDQTCNGWAVAAAGGSATGVGYFYAGRTAQAWSTNVAANTLANYGAAFTLNDVIAVALDMDAGTITFYKNNVSQGVAYSGLTGLTLSPTMAQSNAAATTDRYNFGQRPFVYTPPTGFKALNTQNLPTPSIAAGSTWMDATTYTGNGSTQTITNSGAMQPDLVWIKGRSGATDNALYDVVRGVTLQLESNTTGAETTEAQGVTAFTSTGFTIGSLAQLNTNAATYVGWQWKESVTAGLDIVSYTGTGTGRTVAHNLGVAPNMIIVKARNFGSATDWPVYHTGLTTPANNAVFLSTTAAESASLTYWSNTAATSSVFTVGTASTVNGNTTNYIAYVFANVPGFSQFGRYTGNGSTDGPFIFCGFRPRFVMIKRIDTAGNSWTIRDTARSLINVVDRQLYPNSALAEVTSASDLIDIVSNGFKLRGTSTDVNASAGVYIYAAFAENPFKYALAR